MPSRRDRFEDGREALGQTPVPDQWEAIQQRAGSRSDRLVALDHPSGGMGYIRRRWPTIVGAAALIIVVVGVIAYLRDESPDVSTDEPTRADAIEPEAGAPAEAGAASTSCQDLSLTSSSPPNGIEAGSSDPIPDDPRAPQTLRPDVIGLFAGDTTTRVVLVVAGWPELDGEPGADTDGPFPGTTSKFGSYDDGWFAQISIPTDSGTPCHTTLVGVGLTEADLRQLVDGLTLRP